MRSSERRVRHGDLRAHHLQCSVVVHPLQASPRPISGPGPTREWVSVRRPRAISAAGRRSIPTPRILTGIVFPQGIRDPYVYNDFLSIQREIFPKTVLEVDYVGTISHKLFRAQDINRHAGGRLPAGACVTDNLGRTC